MTVTVNDPNLGEVERTFDLHLPAGYSPDNDLETPLWLDFHGAGFVIGDKIPQSCEKMILPSSE